MKEDDILVACALRFDGYGYLQDHPFDLQQAVQGFREAGEWRISPLEQLAVSFLLQRYLYKWGGEMLSRTSATWKAFRSLFLLVCNYEIPEPYRHGEWYEAWLRDYEPALAHHLAFVRGIHEATEYSDEDLVDPSACSTSSASQDED